MISNVVVVIRNLCLPHLFLLLSWLTGWQPPHSLFFFVSVSREIHERARRREAFGFGRQLTKTRHQMSIYILVKVGTHKFCCFFKRSATSNHYWHCVQCCCKYFKRKLLIPSFSTIVDIKFNSFSIKLIGQSTVSHPIYCVSCFSFLRIFKIDWTV